MNIPAPGCLSRARALLALTIAALLCDCAPLRKVERRDVTPEEVKLWSAEAIQGAQKQSPFLKAHMRNGDLFVLEEWRIDNAHAVVTGKGVHYDPWRRPVVSSLDLHVVPIDSVALFETNHLAMSGAAVALTVVTGVTVAIAIYCASNPKACFGSCPTFYINGLDPPVAEGFSASISPSLEATDIDALPAREFQPGPFTVVMKNEALETHVVRHVDLLAVPHRRGARAFHTDDGRFCSVSGLAPPASASGDEGDCLDAFTAADGIERFVRADSTDLSGTETVHLEFERAGHGTRALVVGCRQTLLSTYILYQAFAYMGRDTGYWLSQVERGEITGIAESLKGMFASITVRIETSPGHWEEIGRITEFGPIAVDQHIIRFDPPAAWTGAVDLEMTRGGWRIDDIALGRAGEFIEPLRLHPSEVRRDGATDATARALLLDPERALTTLPGDTYELVYALPDGAKSYDLFLESRGYYLEWIRNEWIAEENGTRLTELFIDPHAGLRRMAPAFKKAEPDMERIFWSSRYAKP